MEKIDHLNELNINKEDLFHLQEEEINKFKKDNILFDKTHV